MSYRLAAWGCLVLLVGCAAEGGAGTAVVPSMDADTPRMLEDAAVHADGMTRDAARDATPDAAEDSRVCAELETCGDEDDDDCDGMIDETCDCARDESMPCGSDEGVCATGIARCESGHYGGCKGAIDPAAETCNAMDDDCDGLVDEAVEMACGEAIGACLPGVARCIAGMFGACETEAPPTEESCNGIDDDCDGMTDESIVRSCGLAVGACHVGTESCVMGEWRACEGAVDPGVESCNGVDDDCDGAIDERLVRACGTDVGACVAGVETCRSGAFGACEAAIVPATERCEGVADENCNGAIDEGCACTIGMRRVCGTDTGECARGTQRCGEGGMFGECEGEVRPGVETCDGTDQDCDGRVDEDVCSPPTVTCSGAVSVLVGESATLSGAGADPDGGAVTHTFTLAMAPAMSTASLTGAGTTWALVPDRAGSYVVSHCVTDDEGVGACCETLVDAEPVCVPPAAPRADACGVSWDRRPIVELAPLPVGVVYELRSDLTASAPEPSLSATPYAVIDAPGRNYFRPPSEIGPGGPAPGLPATIGARACLVSDRACCSAQDVVRVALIASCTTPVPATEENVVFSEYVANGDGRCPGASCEAGEAIEITNLSQCPVTLEGAHFAYCNPGACETFRYMNFGADDVIPPRGVYVAIRERSASSCTYPFFGSDDPGLFGLRVSTLTMEGDGVASGWFNNAGGGRSQLRVAGGAFVSMTSGATLAVDAPYSGAAGECSSIGFDAIDRCGMVVAGDAPSTVLTPNQLGRLWHPCDAVVAPEPASCR